MKTETRPAGGPEGRPSRREFLRAATLLALGAIGCGGAMDSRATVVAQGGVSVPLIILDRNQTDSSIANMRNYIYALSQILEKMVGHSVDVSRLYDRQAFEGALGAIQIARTAQEVAEEFVGRCNSALTSEEVSPEEMEFLTSRYALAHGLLVDSILKFRDGLGNGSVRGIPASLGYPQIDLFSDF
ncbi:MAG: hypothetical protein AB1657_02315 [Candidatus Micrarchaeota archaeon]